MGVHSAAAPPRPEGTLRPLLACLLVAASATVPLAAQPREEAAAPPASRLRLAGEITATAAPDDPGFFNYTDYEYNALRNVRVSLAAAFRAGRHLQLLGELRVDHADRVEPYAVFARVRPWPSRAFDLQIGRIPPTFGAWGGLGYGRGNLVVGTPLAYQYLLSLRPDAVPASPGDLLRMRGRGWLSSFPVGDRSPAPGVPIVNLSRHDTGVQAHAALGRWRLTAAVTSGTLSNPRVRDDNDGRQWAGRIAWQPSPAVRLGASAASGAFLSSALTDVMPEASRVNGGRQDALGLDLEVSSGRWLVRGEVIASRWGLPAVSHDSGLPRAVSARAWWTEGRYRVAPGVDLAVRAERLTFSTLDGPARPATWEAPVARLEAGAAWLPVRPLTLKLALQHNRRDGGRIRRDTLMTTQVVYWF